MLHSRMSKMYIFYAMLTLAKNMIGIFIPIYLYVSGFPLVSVILYSIGQSLIYLLFTPYTIKIINKIGFKYTILFSFPFYFAHIIFLRFIHLGDLFFHLAWIAIGIHMVIFWPCYHSEIASRGSLKHRGSQIGTLQILATLFASLSPFLGGFILEYYSYTMLACIAGILIFIGILPLLVSRDIRLKKYNFELIDYFKFMKTGSFKKTRRAFSAEGLEMFLNIMIWPLVLYLFFLNENYFFLGVLFSVISFVSVIIVYFLKNYIDRHNKEEVLTFVSRGLSLNWLMRGILFLFGSILIYFVESIFKLLNAIYSISFMSIFYNNAKKEGYMDYIIMREIGVHGMKIIFATLILVLFLLFGEVKWVFFLVILIGVFAALGLSSLKED